MYSRALYDRIPIISSSTPSQPAPSYLAFLLLLLALLFSLFPIPLSFPSLARRRTRHAARPATTTPAFVITNAAPQAVLVKLPPP